MKYLQFKTTGNMDNVPRGFNLDNILLIGDYGDDSSGKAIPVDSIGLSVNEYYFELSNTSFPKGFSSVGTKAIEAIRRSINANPNADVIPCIGTQPKTGDAVLWDDFEWSN
jgi:hypothetical protein